MNLQGKIKTIAPIIERGANNFKTRKMMLDRSSSYQGRDIENYTEISLLGDGADMPEQQQLKVGDYIKCESNVEGRFFDYQGEEKFSQEVKVWKIEVLTRAAAANVQPSTTTSAEDMP